MFTNLLKQFLHLPIGAKIFQRGYYLRQRNVTKPNIYLSHSSVLLRDEQVSDSLNALRASNLRINNVREKNWDALIALDFILRNYNPNSKILDAGAEVYSTLLPWLSSLSYTILTGINLTFRTSFKINSIRYEYGDITNLDYPKDSFDVVTCLSVIEHGVNLEQFFEQMAKIIRKHGHLIISTDYFDIPVDTRDQVAYGVRIKIFTQAEVEKLIELGGKYKFEMVGNIDLNCDERVVTWKKYNLQYTFINLVFKKLSQ
ncbi:MAG: methyltransferase domain-containing protein [Candidatus Heimdallarchaeota archaeon]|nr:methyltransferase domain-containing protein [Candidatus Heimdallarchaeota archaeon]